MIGLPYARVEFDPNTNEPVEICPECGEACPMRSDKHGETVLSTYAAHFSAHHGDETKRDPA